MYSPFKDTPLTINDEGNRISIDFQRTSDSTAIITWGIPANIDNSNLPPATYDGLLVLLDTKPIEGSRPVNTTIYEADNTADANKHVGDKIGDCLVVGVFYNDKATTSLVITDISHDLNYYIAGFAIDNVRNYHSGVFSYQLPLLLTNETKSTKGYQDITLGVLETDSLDIDSKFAIYIDDVLHEFQVTATNYTELVDAINLGIIQIDNTYQGATPLNTNGLALRNNVLYTFDGLDENVTEYYAGTVSPDRIQGGYWQNGSSLFKWNGTGWDNMNAISYHKPLTQLDTTDFWFDGTTAYQYNNVWKKKKTYLNANPCNGPVLNKTSIWTDGTDFFNYVGGSIKWAKLPVHSSAHDPSSYYNGYYWLNVDKVYQLVASKWTLTSIVVGAQPTTQVAIDWYNSVDNKVYRYDPAAKTWGILPIDIINSTFDVMVPGDWYWYDVDNDVLNAWDDVYSNWAALTVLTGADPVANKVRTGDCWYSNTLHQWDGSQWVDVSYIANAVDPKPAIDVYWYDTINNTFKRYDDSEWTIFTRYDGFEWTTVQGCSLSYDPTDLQIGQYWYNTITRTLSTWNGSNWQPVMYSTNSLKPKLNDLWYNTTEHKLYKFNKQWIAADARATCELLHGDIRITSNTVGSVSRIVVPDVNSDNESNVFTITNPRGVLQPIVIGTDAVPQTPMKQQIGVGTDGSLAQRRELINDMLMCLGYPSIQIELDKAQLNLCVDLALAMFRKLSGSAYERAIFFLDFESNKQQYYLTDKKVGLNRIVDVQGVYRRNSSFMASSSGNGIYAQQFLQWMYNPTMGMDLISYHIIAEYTELMEILFATRIVHRFNERSRRLDIYQNIGLPERVLVDCTVERTEQELILDRVCGKWILTWALGEAYMMLANIRGKYGSIPGAGGSVTLNASDMQTHADNCFEKCRDEIDNYIANEPENIGLESTFIWG
jgi:hypothetical protein